MKNYLILIILFSALFSCNKEENNSSFHSSVLTPSNSLIPEQPPCSDHEMLVFNSMEEFSLVMAQINEGKSIMDIQGINFYALIDSYKDEGVAKVEDFIYDTGFSSVLSPEGEIKIGNTIYKVSNQTVLQYTDCEGKLSAQEFINNQKTDRLFNLAGEVVESNELFEVFIPKHELSELPNLRASESHNFEFEENKFLKGEMWNSSWFFYSSIGVETKVLIKIEKWTGDRVYGYPVDEVRVDWDVHFNIQPIASGDFPFVIDCSSSQCSLMCTTNVEDTGSKMKENNWHVKHLFDWAVGISVTLSGGNFQPGVPPGGTAFNYWRHRSDQHCLSNHSAVVNGQSIATPTIFWNPCDVSTEDVVDCEAPTNLKIENISCGTYKLTLLGEGDYSITNWNNTNTSPASTQTSSPSLTVTIPNPGTYSRIKGSVLCTESNESQLFDFDFTRLISSGGIEAPLWSVQPPYAGYLNENYDIELSNPPLGNGDYDIIWESSHGIEVTPSSPVFFGKANIKLTKTGLQTITVTYKDLCQGTETSGTMTVFVQFQ